MVVCRLRPRLVLMVGGWAGMTGGGTQGGHLDLRRGRIEIC